MIPAHQCLGADDLHALVQVARLVVHLQLLLGKRDAQFLFALEPLVQPLIHLATIGTPGSPACFLCLVQRNVGATQQFVGLVGIVGRQGDADAGADIDLLVFVDKGRAEGLDDAVAETVDIGVFAHSVERDDELVTAQPRHEVAVAGVLAQAGCHADQYFVASGVTEGVIHRFEAVQVDVEQCQCRAATKRRQILI